MGFLNSREKCNVKYSTRIYLRCLFLVSLKYSFTDLGNINQLAPIAPPPGKLKQNNDILSTQSLEFKFLCFKHFSFNTLTNLHHSLIFVLSF
jgi:hypothetical protein